MIEKAAGFSSDRHFFEVPATQIPLNSTVYVPIIFANRADIGLMSIGATQGGGGQLVSTGTAHLRSVGGGTDTRYGISNIIDRNPAFKLSIVGSQDGRLFLKFQSANFQASAWIDIQYKSHSGVPLSIGTATTEVPSGTLLEWLPV